MSGGVGGGTAGGSAIKSIQRATITIAANASTGTATIAAVNTAKAIIIWAGGFDSSRALTATAPGATAAQIIAVFTFVNGTTIQAAGSAGNPSFAGTFDVWVVEFV